MSKIQKDNIFQFGKSWSVFIVKKESSLEFIPRGFLVFKVLKTTLLNRNMKMKISYDFEKKTMKKVKDNNIKMQKRS